VSRDSTKPRRIAVVLAGAGARGAYEAGVLSVLLPRLERAGLRPHLYVGTSAGAINACLFAARAHLPAAEQADAALRVWRELRLGDIVGPVLPSALVAGARELGQLLRVPGVRLTGLLNTAPMHDTARRILDWDQLRDNLDNGTCAGLAVTATNARTGRSVVFLDRPGPAAAVPEEDSRPIDYVPTPIRPEHVLASAAIPLLFPPVEVTEPVASRDWYCDGGLRLNTPLKPAIALGADAMIVVATSPAEYPPAVAPAAGARHSPDIDDVMVQLLDAALADPLVEDVHSLLRVNQLVAGGGRAAPGGRPLAEIRFVFVGPAERGTLAGEARDAYRERFDGLSGALRGIAHPDLPLLAHLLAGDGDRSGDALSYLLFDPDFVDRAIDLGRRDASRMLDPGGGPMPWRTTTLS
jgi:NTE family protein